MPSRPTDKINLTATAVTLTQNRDVISLNEHSNSLFIDCSSVTDVPWQLCRTIGLLLSQRFPVASAKAQPSGGISTPRNDQENTPCFTTSVFFFLFRQLALLPNHIIWCDHVTNFLQVPTSKKQQSPGVSSPLLPLNVKGKKTILCPSIWLGDAGAAISVYWITHSERGSGWLKIILQIH